MIRVLGTVLAALLGLAFGSFLNVCLSRWPHGESIVKPRSHCRNCARTLAWWENIPLVSWLALRGRCRTCGVSIGWRYVIVEVAVSALWAFEAWRSLPAMVSAALPLSIVIYEVAIGAFTMLFFWFLVALAVLDAEHLWIPNWITWPGIVLGVLSKYGFAFIGMDINKATEVPIEPPLIRFLDSGGAIMWLRPLLAPLIAAAIILLIRWLYWLIRRREGLGLGDAKLMALLAAWLGFQGALLSLAIGVMLGALMALVLLLVPNRRSGERWALLKLPLGTFLSIGGIVSTLWGEPILATYLRWAGF